MRGYKQHCSNSARTGQQTQGSCMTTGISHEYCARHGLGAYPHLRLELVVRRVSCLGEPIPESPTDTSVGSPHVAAEERPQVGHGKLEYDHLED